MCVQVGLMGDWGLYRESPGRISLFKGERWIGRVMDRRGRAKYSEMVMDRQKQLQGGGKRRCKEQLAGIGHAGRFDSYSSVVRARNGSGCPELHYLYTETIDNVSNHHHHHHHQKLHIIVIILTQARVVLGRRQ
jgi:hypothetical protein